MHGGVDSRFDPRNIAWYNGNMDAKTKKAIADFGRQGAAITNSKLTHETRSKAAKKGWRNRRKKK